MGKETTASYNQVRKTTESYSCHIGRYNDIYVVIRTFDGCRYNKILSRYNDLLSRYNDILSR